MEDLEDANDVVDKRRDPCDRLNSRALIVTDAFVGMFRWTMGFAFFLETLGADMGISGKGEMWLHTLRGTFIYTVHIK